MELDITSKAELKAVECIKQCSFCKGLDLKFIKEQIRSLLDHIGDNGMFAEYTMHDISHVNGMLALLEKIIPDTTRYNMTLADWLMTVLSIYFHDLGMFISNDEYCNRNKNNEFHDFKSEVMKSSNVLEYLNTLEEPDKFLYQEYVRRNHGKRVYTWITECDKRNEEPCLLIREMLIRLDDSFKKDLAKICRSHQEDCLEDSLKSVDEAYGSSPNEKVNLLYVSVLLRSADLLHITYERTPEIEYRIISPKNEISKIEWAKQRAVKSIDIRAEKDNFGNVDKSLPVHVFEIQAKFDNDNGYFSFLNYINYAIKELNNCKRWCQESSKKNSNDYLFPWDNIDISRVQAEGFSKEKLKFEIDQKNILNLLTGHTLYNDSTVVLRELIQNAIDACRLQDSIEKEGSPYRAKVRISWDSKSRRLRIADNATGMDIETISNYLLKVGASKYNSDSFIRKYPDFHSISRFGIGLLTCFMISDDIDIYTLDSQENQCHLLKIRNLNGEYLMRNDADKSNIIEKIHGTTFELNVRDNIDMSNIEDQIKQWILVPEADIELIVDQNNPIKIGFTSEKKAIEKFVNSKLPNVIIDDNNYKIYTKEKGGIRMACLLKCNQISKVWSLYEYKETNVSTTAPIGTCIEGIKVTDNTPGLTNKCYVVLVNCIGKTSPSTNVARNDLEVNETLNNMYRSIYELYFEMLTSQMESLSQRYSQIWAANELNIYIDLFNMNGNGYFYRNSFTNKELLLKSIKNISCNIVDDGLHTQLFSLSNLPTSICTLDSVAYSSAVTLLKDVPSVDKTPLGLLNELDKSSNRGDQYLQDTLMSNVTKDLFIEMYGIKDISIDIKLRRIKFTWEKENHSWKKITIQNGRYSHYHIFYCIDETNTKINGLEDNNMILSGSKLFVCPGTSLHNFMKRLLIELKINDDAISILSTYIFEFSNRFKEDSFDKFFDSEENYLRNELWMLGFSKDEFREAIKTTPFKVINNQKFYHRTFKSKLLIN